VLITKKLHLLREKQHRSILIAPFISATCSGPFSGHQQACPYKNNLKEDTIKLNVRALLYSHRFL